LVRVVLGGSPGL
jgi:hypothetical protein